MALSALPFVKFYKLTITFLVASAVATLADSCPTKIFFGNGQTSAGLPNVLRRGQRLVVSVRINGNNEDVRFVFDSGAGRAVLDRRVGARLGLKPSEKSSIGGAGAGQVPVDVVKNVSLHCGDVRLDGVDLSLVDDFPKDEDAVGAFGYDLLCAAVVTLDYQTPGITVTAPSAFQYHGQGDVLPLTFKGRWPYLRATLKVPGVEPVIDDFLIDTGSEDAVNHPIIRQSKGELRSTRTGAGGFGQSLPGVVGSNEWFRIGRTTIPSTQSVCCAGSDDVSRQIGGEILSRFRITFNCPVSQLILEPNTGH